MKNKTKLQKLKAAPKEKQPQVPAEWLYLTDREISAADIYEALDRNAYPEIQVWTEAGILEIPVAEKASVDMEAMDCDLGDETGNAFLAAQGAKTLFMVTIVPEAWKETEQAMRAITACCGGMFCGDTEDFLPQIR